MTLLNERGAVQSTVYDGDCLSNHRSFYGREVPSRHRLVLPCLKYSACPSGNQSLGDRAHNGNREKFAKYNSSHLSCGTQGAEAGR